MTNPPNLMKTTSLVITSATLVAIIPTTHAQLVVAAPGVEARQDQENIFDVLKYTWEQSQWAEKLATLHNTLSTVRQHLQTANDVKQAIGDPVAAIALIDSGLFSGFLEDSGIADTLGELADIAREGSEISATVGQLFEPIDFDSWRYLATDTQRTFEGVASFRDRDDPMKRFRAVERGFTRFEILLGQAQNKRKVLNRQIARLNTQLKRAADDAEVQKLAGSLTTAQTALDELDSMVDTARGQVELLHVLNENRQEAEVVAAEEISRDNNRELARLAAEAEAELELPDFEEELPDAPPGF